MPLPIKKRSGNKKEIKFLLKRTCFGEYSAVISSLPSPKNVDFFSARSGDWVQFEDAQYYTV